MAKSSTIVGMIGIALCVMLLVNEMADAAPALYDYDNLKDLYDILLRNEGVQNPSRYVHQMERKGGRSPTLRLRFGRRADPLWSQNGPLSPETPAESSNLSS